MTAVGQLVFFMAQDGIHGEELWVTNGTQAGTRLVHDICPGLCSSWPSLFTPFKGKMVFNAEGPQGREVWISDGTSATIIDIVPGTGSSYPGEFEQVGDTLYFSAYTTDHGLWKTDGTAAGTSLVKMMGGGTSLAWLTNAGGKLFFTSFAGPYGSELWVTDGSAAGTRLVKDIHPGPDSATPFGLTVLGSKVVFLAGLGETAGLWISDGTDAGTMRLTTNGYTTDIYPTTHGGLVYYATGASDPNAPMYSTELWRSDGTVGGTYSLGIINPRGVAQISGGVAVVDATCGLWRSDGLRAGTTLVRQLAPQPCQAQQLDITSADGVAMIAIDPDGSRRELWRTNGTASGTTLVHTIRRVPWLAQ